MSEIQTAEHYVIVGCIRTDGKALDDITLNGDEFEDHRLGEIFNTMRGLKADGKPVDAVSVTEACRKHEQLIWSLLDEFFESASTPYHAQLVHEHSVRRRVHEAGVRVQAWSRELTIDDLASKSRKEIDDALGVQKRQIRFMSVTFSETLGSLGRPSTAHATPWYRLSETIGGFRPGALYVIGARPGVGKTSVSIEIALELAKYGTVAYSSLEMPERELHLRAAAVGAWIPHKLLEAPQPLPNWAAQKLAQWQIDQPMNIAFDDRGTVTVNDIRTHARSVSREGKLAGIVVDYLQLISGSADQRRLDVVTEASRQLKLLARDLECPVIALSQLNRAAEKREDGRPALSDLRESGSIEQDADVVILLHRDMQDDSDYFDMVVAKNRHGETRTLNATWHGQFMAVRE